MTKKELRQQMKQLKAITPEAVKQVEADMVFNSIKSMPVWNQAQHILCYWSLPDELPTHDMVNQWLAAGKNIYLPRVKGDDLEIGIRSQRTDLSAHLAVSDSHCLVVGIAEDRAHIYGACLDHIG